MANLSIQELKQNLADILRRIEQGETFVITRHGKPVARLCPAQEPHVHVGKDCHLGGKLEPLGLAPTAGGYLDVLFDDRRGGDR
jgi:prevent-host-death family protein